MSNRNWRAFVFLHNVSTGILAAEVFRYGIGQPFSAGRLVIGFLLAGLIASVVRASAPR